MFDINKTNTLEEFDEYILSIKDTVKVTIVNYTFKNFNCYYDFEVCIGNNTFLIEQCSSSSYELMNGISYNIKRTFTIDEERITLWTYINYKSPMRYHLFSNDYYTANGTEVFNDIRKESNKQINKLRKSQEFLDKQEEAFTSYIENKVRNVFKTSSLKLKKFNYDSEKVEKLLKRAVDRAIIAEVLE